MSNAIQRKIESLTESIADYDRQIEDLAKEAQVLREMKELDEDALATLKERAADAGLEIPARAEPAGIVAQQLPKIITPAEPKIVIPHEVREAPPKHQIHQYGVSASHGQSPGREHVTPGVMTDGRLAQEEL